VCPPEVKTILNIYIFFFFFHLARGDVHSTNLISLHYKGNLNIYFVFGNRVNIVGVVSRIRTGQRKNNGSVPDRMLLFSLASRLTLEPAQHPI
jgi:hypothetical protein